LKSEELNEAQKQAVVTVEGPVLVVAGAGTGKTRTIACRIAYVIDQGINPSDILAITFTNRAAKEMKERTEALVGRRSGGLLITTFHSLGLMLLRENSTDDCVVYDRNDQMNLLRKLLRKSGSSYLKLAETMSRIKNGIDQPEGTMRELITEYQSYLDKLSAVDFDDLILKPLDMFRNEAILRKYRDRFKYIMVDEYQDINYVQYRLLKMLTGHRGNICAVGDSDQAIYAFRGADVENFLNFQEDFTGAMIIRLTDNYRSTKTLLNASGELIRRNLKRLEKDLRSLKDEGRKITVISVQDEAAEGEVIVEEIESRVGGTSHYRHYTGTEAHSKGEYSFSDFVVLTRTNAQSKRIEEVFIRSGIPYQVVGSTHFLDRQEVRDVLAYIKAVVNPSDDISISRVINRPSRGIGEATISDIEQYADRRSISMYDAVKEGSGFSKDKRKRLQEFIALLEHFIRLRDAVAAGELLGEILEKTGLKEFHSEKKDSFITLENLAVAYADVTPPSSTLNFLNDVTLMMPADFYDPIADRVTIMTMHMAKGLEFKTVFIAGAEEGLIPFTRKDDVDIEEERRLFYVAMTRAKDELFILHSRNRFLYGQKLKPSPSPFIKEIPPEFVDERSVPDRVTRSKEKPQMGLF
jgi:DNA helicase-2/ATP-dependent DNA helicase PcrA